MVHVITKVFSCLQWLGFSKFVSTYGIVDGKYCHLADIDLVFRDVNAKAPGKEDGSNPDGMFILNEFLESFIHLAAESYLKVGCIMKVYVALQVRGMGVCREKPVRTCRGHCRCCWIHA